MKPCVPSTVPGLVCALGLRPCHGHRFGRDRTRFVTRRQRLGNPPVHHHDLAERSDHDVVRLQIPVQDASRVSERHRLADTFEDLQPLGEIAMMADVFRQCPAVDSLHDVEQPAVGQPADVVDGHDAGMFECGQDARFGSQPMFECGGRDRIRDLDRHLAAEERVRRGVDRTHAATADLRGHGVTVGFELRPVGDRAQAVDGGVGECGHSISTPNNSRASRRYSSWVPHSARSASSACIRKLRRTCARAFVTCAEVRPNSSANEA